MIRKGERWSTIILHEEGMWSQPTYEADRDMEESEFETRVLQAAGRKFFMAKGTARDEDCPNEGVRFFGERGES